MIALNIGSFTLFAACDAETHFTSRWRRSGHFLFCRLTFSGKTYTSQSTTRPFLKRFSYTNDPTGRLATAPRTPASSKASRAAEYRGDLPFFGQPFGMIQRRVSREVISMNFGRKPALSR